MKGSHLIAVSGRAGPAQPWHLHSAREVEEGWANRGRAGKEEGRVHGRQAIPSSHPLRFLFQVHSYCILPSYTASPQSPSQGCPDVQDSKKWRIGSALSHGVPIHKIVSDCEVPIKVHTKVSLTLTPSLNGLNLFQSHTEGMWLSADHGLGPWAERPHCSFPKHVERQPCTYFHLESRSPACVWPPWVPPLSTQRLETPR